MPVQVRPATVSDTEDVVRVIRAVYDEYGFTWEEGGYHADLYDLAGHYFDRGHLFWIATDSDGRSVGTVALELFPVLPGSVETVIDYEGKQRIAGCDCALNRLYVDPTARRMGVGSALMSAALNEASVRGRRLCEVWSDKKFEDAHRLYGKLGARAVGERICSDPDESPEWGLVLPIP